MIPSARAFSMMSWKHWIEVINDPISILSLKNSVFLGVTGATLGVTLSIFVAYAIVKVRSHASGFLEMLSFLSFSFPGIVIGVGFMWFFVRTPLYATIWALLIGYIATYLPLRGSAPDQCVYPGTQSSGGILQGVRGRCIHHHAPHCHSPAHSRNCIWLDTHGHHVCQGTGPCPWCCHDRGTEVLAVQIFRFAEDGLWGQLSALGIMMIFISTALVILATLVGMKLKPVEEGG